MRGSGSGTWRRCAMPPSVIARLSRAVRLILSDSPSPTCMVAGVTAEVVAVQPRQWDEYQPMEKADPTAISTEMEFRTRKTMTWMATEFQTVRTPMLMAMEFRTDRTIMDSA